MLRMLGLWTLFCTTACTNRSIVLEDSTTYWVLDPSLATGGYEGDFTFPFRSGEYYNFTRGFETASHQDYGGSTSDDRFAMDFAQSGCEVYGDPVTPIQDGTVDQIKLEDESNGYGNTVLVNHGNGLVSRYAHFSKIHVAVGDEVTTQTSLGEVGNTGYVSGRSCAEHPGAHLHFALYLNGEGIPPFQLSGHSDYKVGCWYNREGEENCSGNPGDYDSKEDDPQHGGSGELSVELVDVSPREGIEDETLFTWVSTVISQEEPKVNLVIHNSADGQDYEFPMETSSQQSPWVFTYQKTLRDADTYDYWVEANSDQGEDRSPEHWVRASSDWGSMPEFQDEEVDPSSGRANATDFQWEAVVSHNSEPEISVMIINPSDPTIYEFEMDVDHPSRDEWVADFSKTLNDSTIYTFWFQARDGEKVQNSGVRSVEVH